MNTRDNPPPHPFCNHYPVMSCLSGFDGTKNTNDKLHLYGLVMHLSYSLGGLSVFFQLCCWSRFLHNHSMWLNRREPLLEPYQIGHEGALLELYQPSELLVGGGFSWCVHRGKCICMPWTSAYYVIKEKSPLNWQCWSSYPNVPYIHIVLKTWHAMLVPPLYYPEFGISTITA